MDKIFQTECFSYDLDTAVAQFAATRYRAEFKDGAYPPMLMIAPAAFVGTDMLAAALPASERAALAMDFTEALVELFPDCTAVRRRYVRNIRCENQHPRRERRGMLFS